MQDYFLLLKMRIRMQLELWRNVQNGTHFKNDYNLHQQVQFQAICFCLTTSLI